MAHRKPLGTLCRTNADWDGSPPALHDALVTAAGTWYRIVGIEETKTMRAALAGRLVPLRPYKIRLTLERAAEPRHGENFAIAGHDYVATFTKAIIWDDGYVGRAHDFAWHPRRKATA